MINSVGEYCVRDTCLSVTREGDFLRVTWTRSSFISGYEKSKKDKEVKYDYEGDFAKSSSSLSRTRSIVREYCRCNSWEYFCTFTINPEKFDRFDLSGFYKSFSKYINNLNSRRKDNEKLLYMLVPEQHDNGAWHFHGLMTGIPDDQLQVNENGYLDWPKLRNKFGFCSLSPVKDHEAVTKYIQKYVTKSMLLTQVPKNYRFVLASTGLKKGIKIRKLYGLALDALKDYIKFDYISKEGDCAILTIKPNKSYEEKFLNDLDIIFQESKEMEEVV